MVSLKRNRKPPLEVRSHVDAAWYDGDIFREGSRLRIHFNGFGNKHDEFWEEEYWKNTFKFLEIIRLRSKQLQDFECNKVDPGMIVCANYKTSDGLESKYYDARVISIQESPHVFLTGKKELCKCRFNLVWEAGPLKNKEVFLECADISLIDPEGVEKHPVARMVLQTARDQREESVFWDEDAEMSCAGGVVTDGSEESPPSEDFEVNGGEVDLFPVLDTEGLPDDIVQVMKDHAIFYEALGKEADKLDNAIKVYNMRNSL